MRNGGLNEKVSRFERDIAHWFFVGNDGEPRVHRRLFLDGAAEFSQVLTESVGGITRAFREVFGEA